MPRRQWLSDHINRLNRGCCPIHGAALTQIEYFETPAQGLPYALVGCPRADCDVTATTYRPWGPWVLTPEFAYLVDENPDQPA